MIESHDRYVGSSGAQASEAHVCLPSFLQSTMEPETEPEPEPDSLNDEIGEEPMLGFSDHDAPCPSFPENFWRYACSTTPTRYITSMPQWVLD